jgi:copper(I)-binding protein
MRAGISTTLIFASLLLLSACGTPDEPAASESTLAVTDARIRMPAAGMDMTAAYLTLRNDTATAFEIVGFESPVTDRIELHTMIQDGDMMRMRRLDRITVPPGETLALEPGGLHLMIFALPDPLTVFHATLIGADGRTLPVEFAVVPRGGH